MPSQIAATPILRGEEARRVLEESKMLPTERALKYFERLEEKFTKEIVAECFVGK